MMSMTALLEEEEEGEFSSAPSSNPSPARTPQPSIVKGQAPLPRSSVLLAGKPAKPPIKRRRSRSLDHPPPSLSSSRTSATAKSYKAELQALPKPSGELPSSGTQGYTSLSLPRAMPMRSATVPLPVPNLGIGIGDGKIDLTKAGLAQTTMASVEVVRGLGESVKKLGGLMRVFSRRRATVSNPPWTGRNRTVDLTTDVKGKGRAREKETVLGFTSHRSPPSQVPSGSVVVQVWAVGVDGIDGRLVGVQVDPVSSQSPPPEDIKAAQKDTKGDRPKPKRTLSLRATLGRSLSTKSSPSTASPSSFPPSLEPKKAEVGFIPGRSFVGRVLECGWDVREEVVRRGEWVVGLLDVRKSFPPQSIYKPFVSLPPSFRSLSLLIFTFRGLLCLPLEKSAEEGGMVNI
ncbi:hypothetical protein BDQ17DRAFT_409584 [Cyathus striatus]|nr:hypothetical protein BDQ17DRAFT_409584 [Cyathus striatus]